MGAGKASVPKLLGWFIGTVCGVVFLSALGMVGAALFAGPRPAWVLFGFETVIAISMPMGILFSRGRFQNGQGLALACLAGTIGVGSILGWLGADRHLIVGSGAISLKLWLLGRLVAAVALGLAGAWLVLRRNPRSWWYLWRAVAAGIPLLILLVVASLAGGALSNAAQAMPGWLYGVLAVLGGAVGIVLASASIHCLIRAFELGRITPEL